MDVERVGPNQYRVGRQWVDLEEREGRCSCDWWAWHSAKGPCKHQKVLAEYLKRGQDSE